MSKMLGLIVNPVAGIGGAVALKGSDGPEIQRQALALGAVKKAESKAAQALELLRPLSGELVVCAGKGEMGAELAASMGFTPKILAGSDDSSNSGATSAADTEMLARRMADLPVDLLLFAGGDGTARNICASLPPGFPVVGVPAGVKIHSGVYATSPEAAGRAAYAALTANVAMHEAEVMDIDEDEYRSGRLQARLYGYLSVPSIRGIMQNPKAASHHQADDVSGIGYEIADRIAAETDGDTCYVFGAGSTVNHIMRYLGLEGSLLGVDVVQRGKFLARDATETKILQIAEQNPCKLIITAIGGQGHIFGRGNQQLSPAVIKQIGLDRIWIVAVASKIYSLTDQRLFVDTGDETLNSALRGYRKVIVGYQETLVCQVL